MPATLHRIVKVVPECIAIVIVAVRREFIKGNPKKSFVPIVANTRCWTNSIMSGTMVHTLVVIQ